MNRDEHHVSVLVHQFHNFMHPPLIIFHPYETAKNSHSMIDVNHVVADVESSKVVQGELLALFHCTADADPVETIEYLMIRIAADLVFMVDESGMDVLSCHEFRNQSLILDQDRPKPLYLGILFTEYVDLVPAFDVLADIDRKEFEILVESRLRRDVEFYNIIIVNLKRNVQEYFLERIKFLEEIFLAVHVGRICPDYCPGRENTCDAGSRSFITGHQVREYFYFCPFFYRQLGVTVEHMDLFNLIAEE